MNVRSAKQLLHYLPGMWKITREIYTQIDASFYNSNGYGTFTESADDPNVLFYSEQVIALNNGLASTIGTKKYKYKYDITSHEVSKYFTDDRLFYQLNILENKASGEHLCSQDLYIANYIFEGDQFKLTYLATGPFKNYEIVTQYSKIKS